MWPELSNLQQKYAQTKKRLELVMARGSSMTTCASSRAAQWNVLDLDSRATNTSLLCRALPWTWLIRGEEIHSDMKQKKIVSCRPLIFPLISQKEKPMNRPAPAFNAYLAATYVLSLAVTVYCLLQMTFNWVRKLGWAHTFFVKSASDALASSSSLPCVSSAWERSWECNHVSDHLL